MNKIKIKEKEEENYKAIILIFAGVQVMIALIQLVQSTMDSKLTSGKIFGILGLGGIAVWLWCFNKKIK